MTRSRHLRWSILLLAAAGVLPWLVGSGAGPWVDVMAAWNPTGRGCASRFCLTAPAPDGRMMAVTLVKSVGGIHNRLWGLSVEAVDAVAPPQRMALERTDHRPPWGRVGKPLLEYRFIGSNDNLVWPDPAPGIWYRVEGDSVRFLVYQPGGGQVEDFGFTPGYFTCRPGEPWRACDRWGRVAWPALSGG